MKRYECNKDHRTISAICAIMEGNQMEGFSVYRVGNHALHREAMQGIHGGQDSRDILQEVKNYDEI
jgi:hypothetical protein